MMEGVNVVVDIMVVLITLPRMKATKATTQTANTCHNDNRNKNDDDAAIAMSVITQIMKTRLEKDHCKKHQTQ